MEKTKVLFISQEITPYLPETDISNISRNLPQGIQEKGKEIRTFMPKYGCINERRNQLHEVIRLSGMNLIIDDTDRPLIIKVASIQTARMQVYFIDNEDYFHRKSILKDEKGNFFEDNDERALFFARGVIETVIKLRWTPDIVHCHGWFTSFAPVLVKKAYHDDPLFANSKVVLSLYNDQFEGELDKGIKQKLLMDGIDKKNIAHLNKPDYENVSKLAMDYSDGFIMGSQKINPNLEDYLSEQKKPILEYQNDENYIDAYSQFYDQLLERNKK